MRAQGQAAQRWRPQPCGGLTLRTLVQDTRDHQRMQMSRKHWMACSIPSLGVRAGTRKQECSAAMEASGCSELHVFKHLRSIGRLCLSALPTQADWTSAYEALIAHKPVADTLGQRCRVLIAQAATTCWVGLPRSTCLQPAPYWARCSLVGALAATLASRGAIPLRPPARPPASRPARPSKARRLAEAAHA